MQDTDTIPLPFETLDQSLQIEINKKAKELNFKKSETPFMSDETTKNIYLVQKGKIKTYQLNINNGREQTLYIYRENHIFDTTTLLDGEEHNVCYEVLEDTELLVFPIDFIRELLHNSPEFSQKFYLYIAKQMRYLEETLTDISLYSTSERLVKLIVQDFQPSNIFRFNILKGLSNTESAKLLGTIRNVVERHLKDLKNEKLIDITNRKIQIIETNRLLDKIKLLS